MAWIAWATRLRTRKPSAASSNTMVTTDSPKSEMDRRETRWGNPFSAFSTGMVTNRSTSSAACPGHSVMTCAWMFVTSG